MPELKIGVVAVSRDCFPESLSVTRRENLIKAYKEKYGEADIYECPICIVESEIHMVQALEDIKNAGCNALVVYLGNFGPEIAETLLAKHFDGPKMFIAAAEESGDNLVQGRGDAYCGMLNASYNLKLRNIKAYIPEYPVGNAEECADMIAEFRPIARAVIGLNSLKIISFGPRPLNFLACNAPIQQLYNLGVEIEENSELDLFEAFHKHDGDERIPAIVKEMEAELGAGNKKPEILAKLAQYELTLKDWVEEHRGYRKYVAIAGKCLLDQWRDMAYDRELSKEQLEKFWGRYFSIERGIYEQLLTEPDVEVKGTVKELAEKYGQEVLTMVGFLDGINDSLKVPNPIETMTEDTEVNLIFDKELLYKNMIDAKADWLYELPQWNAIFDEEKKKQLYREQKQSGTIRKGKKIGRNDPCPCGSGKKYKMCCGRNA